jgi:hypothetical protein
MKLIIYSFSIFYLFSLCACNDELKKEVSEKNTETEYSNNEEKIKREYISPQEINKLFYEGNGRFGWGTFYKENFEFGNEILNVKVEAVEPSIRWYGNNIAEIYIYTGPGFFYSYIYSFEYNILTPQLPYVIDVLADDFLIINTIDTTSFNISTLVPHKLVQKIKVDGLYGDHLLYNIKNKYFKFKIFDNCIILESKVEPHTFKELDEPLQFVFRKEF